MYLPIFNEDRELVLSVLTEAMKKLDDVEVKSPEQQSRAFYEIADDMGRQRSSKGIFLGPEAASEQCLGGVEYACKNALFIFAVDFNEKRIVTLK